MCPKNITDTVLLETFHLSCREHRSASRVSGYQFVEWVLRYLRSRYMVAIVNQMETTTTDRLDTRRSTIAGPGETRQAQPGYTAVADRKGRRTESTMTEDTGKNSSHEDWEIKTER